MKILALDIGDQWTGSAISDPLGIVARPYQTVATSQLQTFICNIIEQERVEFIIVGHPKTLRGTISAQTEKTEQMKNQLEQCFPQVQWKLWDERLTSKMASQNKKTKTKEEKLKSHSIAAAFILDSYLSYLQNQKNMQ